MTNSYDYAHSSDEKNVLWYAQQYHAAGFRPIPLHPKTKQSAHTNWPALQLPFADLSSQFTASQNVAVVLGEASNGLVDIDLDCPEAIALAPYFLPETAFVFGRASAPKSHYVYKIDVAPNTKAFKHGKMIVELRGEGGFYSVFPGSTHETGEAVEFSVPSPTCIPVAAMSDAETLLLATTKIAIGTVLLRKWSASSRHALALAASGFLAYAGWCEEDVASLIFAVAECANDEEIDDRLRCVRTTFEKLNEGILISKISALNEALGEDGAALIKKWTSPKPFAMSFATVSANSNIQVSSASFATEASSAEAFSAHYDGCLKYSADRKQWYVKTDAVFEPIGDAEMQGTVTKFVKEVSQANPSLVVPTKMESRARINSVIDLARWQCLVAEDKIDSDKRIVGLKDGRILDLSTRRYVYDGSVFITKKLGAAYDPEASCPTWVKFLNRIFEHDQETIRFIQRAIGYTLTGETSEQAMFILVGSGANGKSTLLAVLDYLFKDYAAATPMHTLTASKFNSGQTADLAAIAGARFVAASDGEANEKLAASKIKGMTGGDRLACRFLYGNFIYYYPQFKLWVATNDVPEAPGCDEALMRRIKMIRFPVQIPVGERDANLTTNLQKELPGILNWALDGYDDWSRIGLAPPSSITAATESYKKENDPVGRFIEDCCVCQPEYKTPSAVLFEGYVKWCSSNGNESMPQTEFGKILGKKEFGKSKINGNSAWKGIALRLDRKMNMAAEG
jgi:putative DNA primase/helicase